MFSKGFSQVSIKSMNQLFSSIAIVIGVGGGINGEEGGKETSLSLEAIEGPIVFSSHLRTFPMIS